MEERVREQKTEDDERECEYLEWTTAATNTISPVAHITQPNTTVHSLRKSVKPVSTSH